MKSYILPFFLFITLIISCKKTDTSDNNPTPAEQFQQYEGNWLVAETINGSTFNYNISITVNDDGSLVMTNLGYYHKTVTASYRDYASPPHAIDAVLVDVSTNTTMFTDFVSFNSTSTSKTMALTLTYSVNGGSSSLTGYLNATKQ